MKPGDIVTVNDGSWSMAIIKGSLEYVHGDNLAGRRLRVLSTGGKYPTDDRSYHEVNRNDVMVVDENDPSYVLFTRQSRCRVVTPAPDAPFDTVDVTIPPGVTTVKLHFEPCSTCGEEQTNQ